MIGDPPAADTSRFSEVGPLIKPGPKSKLWCVPGQYDSNARAFVDFTFNIEPPGVQADPGLDDRQTQAGTFLCDKRVGRGAHKRFGQTGELSRACRTVLGGAGPAMPENPAMG